MWWIPPIPNPSWGRHNSGKNSKENNSTGVGENKECLDLSVCHFTVSQSCASYHTSFERGESWLSADQKILNFFNQIAIFKHIFEWCRPHASKLHIFACHTFTSWRRWGYHTSFERGRSGLSSDPNWIDIFGEIGLIQAQSPFKSGPPRTPTSCKLGLGPFRVNSTLTECLQLGPLFLS